MRKDAVTPELREAVFERDRAAVADELAMHGFPVRWMGDRLEVIGAQFPAGNVMQLTGNVVCPAILIDVTEFGKCKGRWTIEHVKDQARLGVRAASDLAHCLALCEGHTENGMTGGVIWNTAHRPELRAYLGRFA